MVNLTINSIPVTVPEGTTILDAAASVDIEIPSLCYLKELNEISACRVCCVEVEGEGKLVPSCNNVVREGMVIRTNSPRALEARRVNMELILSQHDNKCATCIRSGTCQLQMCIRDRARTASSAFTRCRMSAVHTARQKWSSASANSRAWRTAFSYLRPSSCA